MKQATCIGAARADSLKRKGVEVLGAVVLEDAVVARMEGGVVEGAYGFLNSWFGETKKERGR